jgi:nucleoside-diphosphate-sugar epimerase
MKVTITGTSGFVGTNLQDYLRTSYDIEAMSVRYISNQQFDLKSDAIIHLAGKAHDLKKVSKPAAYYEANFELTKQLFDAFLNSEAKTFVFMSTVKAVADEVKGKLSEDKIPNPKTHYGIAKHQAEQYILNHKLPEGKRVFILRPCMIHGPGNKGNLNLLYQLVAKGLPWPLGDFQNKELLENTSIPSGVYQVSDDEPLSTNELIQLLGTSLGKKNRILIIPSSWIKGVARLGDYLHLPLNSERLQKLTENYVVSNKKLLHAIGKPLPIESKEGLLKTFQSFKK